MLRKRCTKYVGRKYKMASKVKTKMRDWIRGALFCFFWYLSIIVGFFFMICPMLPLVLISPKNYRKWSDVVLGVWEPFPVAMMEVCLGIRAVLTGDRINPFEGSLIVANHRTRVDWNFLWLGLFHSCQSNAHNAKFVLKAPLMHLPGPGWVMQTCSFIFVNRNWEKDKSILDKMIDYLNGSDQLYQVLLFPEGTDLSDDNVRKSHKFADEHNLERYHKVLHPRTTGFAFLAHKMKTGRQLGAVYDVTIAYPKTMPTTEMDLLRGKFPEEVHFHVKRYSSLVVPLQEEDLKNWLKEIWREKEMKLRKFYATGYFAVRERNENEGEAEVDEEEGNDGNDGNEVDFGSLNVKNGAIAYKHGESFDSSKPVDSDRRNICLDGSTSSSSSPLVPRRIPTTADGTIYRPSHLLYTTLAFWSILMGFAIHQIFHNFYLQIWVLTHSFLFAILSFVSNGFHQIAASVYFYRHDRKPRVAKKRD